MIPTLAQVCSLPAPFDQDLEDYAAGQCRAVELWLGKLETYLETHSVDDVRRLCERLEITTPVASFQGGLLLSQGEARRAHWDHFQRRLELLRDLGTTTLVIAGDLRGPIGVEEIGRVQVSLAEGAKRAAEYGLRLAFEFDAQASLANNLESAAALVGEIGSPHLGLCLDLFHYYTGPSKFEDLAWLTPQNLFHVQLSDLLGVARERASDADRILPGDGDFQTSAVIDALRQIGYSGTVSVEVMNPQLWRVPPRSFGEVALTALRKLLGQASMD